MIFGWLFTRVVGMVVRKIGEALYTLDFEGNTAFGMTIASELSVCATPVSRPAGSHLIELL